MKIPEQGVEMEIRICENPLGRGKSRNKEEGEAELRMKENS